MPQPRDTMDDNMLNKRLRDSPQETPTSKRPSNGDEVLTMSSLRSMLVTELNSALDQKLTSIATKSDVSSLKTDLVNVEASMHNHEVRLTRIEQKNRSKNLIFKNIPQKNNYKEYISSLLHGMMELPSITFGSIYTLNTIKEKNKVILLVEFGDNNSVYEVLGNTFKLKGTGIIVEKDLCPEDRIRKSALLKIRRELLKRISPESGEIKIVVSEKRVKVNDEIFLFDRIRNEFLDGNGLILREHLLHNFDLNIDANLNVIDPQQ